MFEHFYIFPESAEVCKAAIAFLRDSYSLGTFSLTWEDCESGYQVGIRLDRVEREGEYYRDPYPVMFSVIAPRVRSLPEVSHAMDADAIAKLISLLEAEAAKLEAEAEGCLESAHANSFLS